MMTCLDACSGCRNSRWQLLTVMSLCAFLPLMAFAQGQGTVPAPLPEMTALFPHGDEPLTVRPDGSIDFDLEDRLDVPRSPCGNLIPNGSFEQGLSGWAYDYWGVSWNVVAQEGGMPLEEIVQNGRFGAFALKFRTLTEGKRRLRRAFLAAGFDRNRRNARRFVLCARTPRRMGQGARDGRCFWLRKNCAARTAS